jgi:hypothetical protein
MIPDFQGVVSPDTGLQVVITTLLHHVFWLSSQSRYRSTGCDDHAIASHVLVEFSEACLADTRFNVSM